MSIFNVFLKIAFILFGMLHKNVILWIVKILLKHNFVVQRRMPFMSSITFYNLLCSYNMKKNPSKPILNAIDTLSIRFGENNSMLLISNKSCSRQ